jgi:hypothetical protein
LRTVSTGASKLKSLESIYGFSGGKWDAWVVIARPTFVTLHIMSHKERLPASLRDVSSFEGNSISAREVVKKTYFSLLFVAKVIGWIYGIGAI